MGLIERLLSLIFGGGGNVIRDTAEVFIENAEASAVRDAALAQAALGQFAAEFAVPRRGVFDRAMDGINRLPRPMMALGTLGLFGAAMVNPVWFAARMEGIALVPEPLWWLLGAVVSFYFGARHQAKGHEYQQNLIATLARTRAAARDMQALEAATTSQANPALDAWRAGG
ncbi:MAG: holin family protein [Pseudomonadota bacterium]